MEEANVHQSQKASTGSSTAPCASQKVVVIGAGVLGTWTAIAAAKQGASVTLIEQFSLGHSKSPSYADTRIYHDAHENERHIELLNLSFPLWKELEQFAGRPLLRKTGGIIFDHNSHSNHSMTSFPTSSSSNLPKTPLRSAILHRIQKGKSNSYIMTAPELHSRFAVVTTPKDSSFSAIFSPNCGLFDATSCMEAAWAYCRKLGVNILDNFPVEEVECLEENSLRVCGQDLVTQKETATKVILAPGAWMAPLMKRLFGITIPMKVTKEHTFFYKGDSEAVEGFPSVVETPGDSGTSSPCRWISPAFYGNVLRTSSHCSGTIFDIDSNAKEELKDGNDTILFPSPTPQTPIVSATLSALCGDLTKPLFIETSLAATTADGDFIVSAVPDTHDVFLVGGGSGHAFKFAPAIGECTAALALGSDQTVALQPFDIHRILRKN